MKKILLAVTTLALFSVPAHAETKWDKAHPRRHEVLHRANKQEHRETAAYRQGKITGRQDHQLHREDQAIKRQEQADARRDHGHITKAEQRQLNREENHVNHQLKHDERVDASAH